MILGHNTMAAGLVASLGARPDMSHRANSPFFLTAACIFLLGMLALLGYIYLEPVRQRLYPLAGPEAPGERVAAAPGPGILFHRHGRPDA